MFSSNYITVLSCGGKYRLLVLSSQHRIHIHVHMLGPLGTYHSYDQGWLTQDTTDPARVAIRRHMRIIQTGPACVITVERSRENRRRGALQHKYGHICRSVLAYVRRDECIYCAYGMQCALRRVCGTVHMPRCACRSPDYRLHVLIGVNHHLANYLLCLMYTCKTDVGSMWV